MHGALGLGSCPWSDARNGVMGDACNGMEMECIGRCSNDIDMSLRKGIRHGDVNYKIDLVCIGTRRLEIVNV
jgi:hypothetical protein